MHRKADSETQFILELSDVAPGDTRRVGIKAANEAAMFKAGFLVPDGFVLTTDAYGHFLAANDLGRDSAPAAVATASIPSDIVAALTAGATSLGEGPLAVRSSANAEDLPGASFAGQYETFLNVQGAEVLEGAVRSCWASIFDERAAAYRKSRGLEAGEMAVLVQRMVTAEAAGVAFTANPISGDRDEVVINAVRGLGERLVSGEASPDEWGVKNGEVRCSRAPEGAIDADLARTIAEMARRVETHFGRPQDIEWAQADGQLFVLQARPITTLPDESPEMIPVSTEPPPGYWLRNASHAPQPHSPMNRSQMMSYQRQATKRWLDEFGLLFEGIDFQEIGGWEYVHLVPLGGKEGPVLPSWLMWLLARLVPAMRARIKQAAQAMRDDKPGDYVSRWHEDWFSEQVAEMEALRDVELPSLSDAALDEHLGRANAFLLQSMVRHALLHGSEAIILYELVTTCRQLLGWDAQQALALVSGTSYKSTEPARRLADMAKMAQERPAILTLLERADERSTEHLAAADETFAAAFAAYMREYGCRALRYEVMDPTIVETPALILQLIHGQIERGYDPTEGDAILAQQRTELISEAHSSLAANLEALQRFDRVLGQAERAYPVREDNEFYTVSAPLALLRYALLEFGVRLAQRAVIAERDDVFFLEFDEAKTAFREGGDYHQLVQRRKAERAWALAHPGPTFYGKEPGPPPSFNFLPDEARLVMESLLWFIEQNEPMGREQTAEVTATSVVGIAASSGEYTGPVRIIMNEEEFDKLLPGDVLVCPITSPVWSVLFPNVGALVTDVGGILSHPAIIAREYRVPAVVSVGNATTLLRDGQIVTVDGTAGRVTGIM